MLYAPNPKPTLAGFVIYTLPALLALGAALFVLLVRRRAPGRAEQGAILLGLTAALAMIAPVVMSVLQSGVPYDIRYTSAGFPFYCGLVAIGATLISAARAARGGRRRDARRRPRVTAHQLFKPYKEDWRGALRMGRRGRAPGRRHSSFHGDPGADTWAVYHPRRPRSACQTRGRARGTAAGRVWLFVYSRTVIAERAGHATAAALERHG